MLYLYLAFKIKLIHRMVHVMLIDKNKKTPDDVNAKRKKSEFYTF
jgi:hypothetical protein